MGAAQTSNAASAVANVANFVNNSTTANSSAVNDVEQQMKFTNCYIKLSGDFNAKSSATLVQKNNQIIAAKQDTNVVNNIAQQLSQQATSKVGSLGIGYADASNSASEMVNDTNQIINAMTVGCSQYSSVDQKFDCDQSTIIAKNLNIGFDSSSDFLSTQTLNNDQVTNVVNDISQTITQKATATVEGLSAMLIMVLLMIAVIVYVAMKPLSSGAAKTIVGVSLCFVFVGIVLLMYLRGTPPFFSKLNECINGSSIGMGGAEGNVPNCINLKDGKISLANPPLKYIYAVSPLDTSQPGANLVQIAIAAYSGQSEKNSSGPNGGYTADTFNNLASKLNNTTYNNQTYADLAANLKIPMIPNPLVVPMSSDGKYYGIPIEYNGTSGGGSGQGDTTAQCTPGTVQVGVSGDASDFSSCPLVADPKAFTMISAGGDPTNIVANLNSSNWSDYINVAGAYGQGMAGFTGSLAEEAQTRALFARFVLCDIIGNIDLHMYVVYNAKNPDGTSSNVDEYVKFTDQYNNNNVGLASDFKEKYPNDVYIYHPYSYPGSWSNGSIGPGYTKGKIGVVDDNNYRFQNFMRKFGAYILIGIVVAIFAYMGYVWYNNKYLSKTDTGKAKS
jgi:hypothetical protein